MRIAMAERSHGHAEPALPRPPPMLWLRKSAPSRRCCSTGNDSDPPASRHDPWCPRIGFDEGGVIWQVYRL
jgi:hypothetical protein